MDYKNKKYRFTGYSKYFGNVFLHQIQYIKRFGRVSPGQLGGWIESEENLSHEGLCYISKNSIVKGNARVEDDAIVKDLSIIKDNAKIQGKAKVEKSFIGADTIIISDSWVLNSDIQIFESINQERHGILGSSKIVGCSIVATGAIFNSQIENKTLTGELKLFM